MTIKSVAIITARGGSKRIPRKNIKSFAGHPIIKYPIEAALQSKCFDEVMVSTDDKEIAEISKKYGAKIPFMRSERTATDFASTIDVLEEVLQEYKKLGQNFEYFCCIYPCTPFITPQKIINGMNMLKEKGADSVIPVARYPVPAQWAMVTKDNCLTPLWPELLKVRSQDIQPTFHDTGQFYCMKTSLFFEYRTIYTKFTLPMEIPEIEVQDIDTPEDWIFAEMKYEFLKRTGKISTN